MPRLGPNGGPASLDPLELIKTTITVAGFVGAVLVGVYGYRKQRLVEGDARRADAEQLAQRYTTAAGQLGHEKAAVRLAGVYAMARLVDDWAEQKRQVCLDVLCAYLGMPYEPDTASEKHLFERDLGAQDGQEGGRAQRRRGQQAHEGQGGVDHRDRAIQAARCTRPRLDWVRRGLGLHTVGGATAGSADRSDPGPEGDRAARCAER